MFCSLWERKHARTFIIFLHAFRHALLYRGKKGYAWEWRGSISRSVAKNEWLSNYPHYWIGGHSCNITKTYTRVIVVVVKIGVAGCWGQYALSRVVGMGGEARAAWQFCVSRVSKFKPRLLGWFICRLVSFDFLAWSSHPRVFWFDLWDQ